MHKAEQKELELALTQFLQKYKTTPHPATLVGRSEQDLTCYIPLERRRLVKHTRTKRERKAKRIKGRRACVDAKLTTKMNCRNCRFEFCSLKLHNLWKWSET